MARKKFSNAGSCTLSSAVGATDLSIALQSGKGAKFPTSDFRIVMRRADLTYEIAQVASRSGDTLTIALLADRGLEGTAAITFGIGDYVAAIVSKGALEAFAQIDETNTFSAIQSFSKPIVMSASMIKAAAEVDVASAATLDVSADAGNQIRVTGTTTISAITAGYRGPLFVRFAGVLALTHGANLDLPGGVNIATETGDRCVLMPNAAGTGWIVWSYSRASGKPVADSVPPGMLGAFGMTAAPSGWLKCNGIAVSRATYDALFTTIGTTYGVGDGSTTFNVPEYRGEFLRGWDDGRGIDSGRAIGVAQAQDIQSHTHTYYASDPGGTRAAQDSWPAPVGWSTKASGSTGGTETRPRNVAALICIKT